MGRHSPCQSDSGTFYGPRQVFRGERTTEERKKGKKLRNFFGVFFIGRRTGAHYTLSYSLAEDAASKGIIGHERREREREKQGREANGRSYSLSHSAAEQ